MGTTTLSLQPLIGDANVLGNSEQFAVTLGLSVNVSAYFIGVALAPRAPVQHFAGIPFLGTRLGRHGDPNYVTPASTFGRETLLRTFRDKW